MARLALIGGIVALLLAVAALASVVLALFLHPGRPRVWPPLDDPVHPIESEHTLTTTTTTRPWTIVSVNLFCRPPPITDRVGARGDRKWQRLHLFARHHLKPEYDVICIQELFASWSGRVQWLRRKAHRAGFVHFLGPTPKRPWTYCDSGLVVLSRHPITEAVFHRYGVATGADRLSDKGIQQFTLHPPGSSAVMVLHTHMQAYYKPNDVPRCRAKRAQLAQLAEVAQRAYRTDRAVVVVGDLNINGIRWSAHPEDVLYNELHDALPQFHDALWESAGTTCNARPTTCTTVLRDNRSSSSSKTAENKEDMRIRELAPDMRPRLPKSYDYVLHTRPLRQLRAWVDPMVAEEDSRTIAPHKTLSDHYAVAVTYSDYSLD